ncbi:MAG: CotH kinase family protein [Bacteroidota bacterium]
MSQLKFLLFFCISFFCLQQQSFAQLYINELMAKNDNVISDEFDEFDDWIEIYNAGSNDRDLAGLIFADGANEWPIPANDPQQTIVPAGGYLLIWADDDTEQGAHHISFKLGAGGETITLFESDGSTVIDQVEFGAQNSNLSFGRTTDGAADFEIFANPTPRMSNASGGMVSYQALISAQISSGADDAEEPVGFDFLSLDDNIIRIVNDWSGDQTVGFRFTNLEITPGATIKSAHIEFITGFPSLSVGPCDIDIYGHNTGNAPTFENTAQNISNRPFTSASVNWQPEDWDVPSDPGEVRVTPDLSTILQEVIDRPDWGSGNAVALVMQGTGVRAPFAYEQNPEQAAKLFIEVALPAPTTPVTDLYINEIVPGGTDFTDETGDFEDWVEIYNGGNTAVNIGGLFLTDSYSNLTKWQISAPRTIPPNGFAVIFADKEPFQGGLHADFNLEASGERLALVQLLDGNFSIIDSISFPSVPFKASYGRETDGSNTWITFGQITPDASNNGALPALVPPTIVLQGGIYSGTESTAITHPDNGVSIRYTTDGSEPDENSPLYSNPISIDESTSLRARAFRNGFVPSQSTAASYLIDVPLHLPALYINSDPAHFFDDETGIYVEGTNGIPGFCRNDPVNWNQDWERPIHLSMFGTDGTELFAAKTGVKIGGGCSRSYAQKSLNIYLRRNTYGSNPIDYPIFSGRENHEYRRLKLRNSGQDYLRTMFRDGLVQTLLWDKVDIDLQAFRPSVLYINGAYWGIHNIRELFTDEYFNQHYNIDQLDLDLIKNPAMPWVEVKTGNTEAYDDLFNFAENNDLSTIDNYNFMEASIDMNEFLNYWIASIYIAKYDWPANNLIVWRERKAGAKWRWGVMDNDGSTANGFSPETEPGFNTLDFVMDDVSTEWPNHRSSTLFFRKLLDNQGFRDEYIQRTCSFIGLVYSAERSSYFIDSLKMMIDPEINNQIDRWGDDLSVGGDIFSWEAWVDKMRDFFVDRPGHMHTFINDHFQLNNTYELTLNYNENTGGFVVVNQNEMETPYNFKNQYFKGIPLRVKAIAKPNYVFSHWLETGATDPVIDFVANEDAVLTPVFMNTVNVEEVQDLQSFELYPNPSAGQIQVSLSFAQANRAEIRVYNLLGQQLYSSQQEGNTIVQQIDLSNFSDGIYIVSVETANGKALRKVMLRKE